MEPICVNDLSSLGDPTHIKKKLVYNSLTDCSRDKRKKHLDNCLMLDCAYKTIVIKQCKRVL